MYASNYFENLMMSLLMGGTGIPAPLNLYLALFASNPGESGSAGTEISYTGYERMPITFDRPAVSGSGLAIENNTVITFTEAPASSGTVQYVGIFDQVNGGNMWLYGPLTTPLNIQAGVSPVFQVGALKWTWSGNLSSYYRGAIMNVLSERTSLPAFIPYIGLYNGDPLTSGQELSGSQYARMRLSMQESEIQPESGALRYENSNEITSPTAGTGGWGTLTHIAILDAASGGNVFAGTALTNNASYSITYGSVVGFHPGDLTFSIN